MPLPLLAQLHSESMSVFVNVFCEFLGPGTSSTSYIVKSMHYNFRSIPPSSVLVSPAGEASGP